ncbi:hypothetical protein Prum_035680 [Phytohabitans rumicis]|uniref:Uncharacterized protein n=1 Tax=Phytohabitans rumicis TaxID=1076125 RepID=A0A6V8L733_9ACTN|nr:hypothetical protein Prum_035680 [Phytohabitans rumicis]
MPRVRPTGFCTGAIGAGRANVGFEAHANGSYVAAESRGTKPLIANRARLACGSGLTRWMQAAGYIALKPKVNGKYVTAETSARRR